MDRYESLKLFWTVCLWLIVLSIVYLAYRRRLIGAPRASKRVIVVSLLLYISLSLLPTIGDFVFRYAELRVPREPFAMLQSVIVLYAGITLILATSPGGALHSSLSSHGNIDKLLLDGALRHVLSSDRFLSTINTALPVGSRDAENGLDFIPFLLASIGERRRRCEKAAWAFLSATLLVGITFSGVLLYFGYILVNEESAGTPRELRRMTSELATAASVLDQYGPRATSATLKYSIGSLLDSYVQHAMGSPDAVKPGDLDSLRALYARGDLASLGTALAVSLDTTRITGRQLRNERDSLSRALSAYKETAEAGIASMQASADRLRAATSQLSAVTDKDDARVAEVIKRLAIGIVVSSFFLVILRYVAGLYKSYHMQAAQAEADDYSVRRFYITFRASADDKDSRKAVLASFVALAPTISGEALVQPNLSADESGILKEFISAIAKKL